jgi:kynureninase
LHDWNLDFAAWCSYKYLNSGPGSLGSIFIHDRHGMDLTIPRLSGWWGHNKETRFTMRDDFDPLPGAEGWQLSNPPILPMAAMRASLEIFDAAGMDNLQSISRANVSHLYDALSTHPQVRIITPARAEERGSQLSLFIEENGRHLFDQLTGQGVIADWREPNVIRIAVASLYNTQDDIDTFLQILQQTLIQA